MFTSLSVTINSVDQWIFEACIHVLIHKACIHSLIHIHARINACKSFDDAERKGSQIIK